MKQRTFIGAGPFPLDMLRVDNCFPWSQMDVSLIYESIVNEDSDVAREVTVQSVKSEEFNLIQWAAFGWTPKLP